MQGPYPVSWPNYDLEYRSAAIHQMIVEADVDVILTGHEHMYEHLIFGTTHQFVVGTGGAGLAISQVTDPESQMIVRCGV